jgi:hypothetical protein
MKDSLDLLDHIQKTPAPPFLLTRVRARIAAAQADRVPPRLAWSLGMSLLIVLALNIAVILQQLPKQQDVAVGLNLLPDNALYHD